MPLIHRKIKKKEKKDEWCNWNAVDTTHSHTHKMSFSMQVPIIQLIRWLSLNGLHCSRLIRANERFFSWKANILNDQLSREFHSILIQSIQHTLIFVVFLLFFSFCPLLLLLLLLLLAIILLAIQILNGSVRAIDKFMTKSVEIY